MKRHARTTLAAAAAAGALLLTGCASPQAVATGERVDGGTIRYGHQQEPPCIYGSWIQNAYLSRQVLDSLVAQADGGKIVPWLAESWTVSADQRVWTFTLADGVSFTDGTPFTAEAVRANFEYWVGGGNGTAFAYIGSYYESSRAVDERTFELTLRAPYSPLLSVLSQGYFGIQSPTALDRGAEANCEQPIGTGPFTVADWKRGESVTFERNADYNSAPANAKHQGPAYVDGIEWRFLADPTTRYGSLISGESDVIYDVPTVNWQAAQQQFEVQQYITPGRPVTLSLNTVEGPFTDVLVRKAFAFSLDRESIVESAFNGAVPFEGNGSLSQSTPGYNADVVDDYTYQPDTAARLLDEAGWNRVEGEEYRTKDGEKLEVRIAMGIGSIITQQGSTALQSVQQQAKDVGFTVTIIPVTQSDLFAGKYAAPNTHDIYPGYWTSPTAGILHINYRQNLPESPNPNNSTFFNSAELESTILAANSTLDIAEQNRLYGQAQQLISDQALAVGLYPQTTSLAIRAELKDVWIEDSQGEPVFHDAYFVR